MVRLPGLGIFNVYTGVDACDCTRGCADTAGESALTVDCGRKIPCCTGDSNPHRAVLLLAFPSDALPTELSSLVSGLCSCVRLPSYHTPSSAFRHLPPNSARIGYASRGTLYLRGAVHRRCQHPPKGLGADHYVETKRIAPNHSGKLEARPPRVRNEFRLDSNYLGFVRAVVRNGYKERINPLHCPSL